MLEVAVTITDLPGPTTGFTDASFSPIHPTETWFEAGKFPTGGVEVGGVT